MLPNGLLVPGVGNRFNGLVIGGDSVPEDQQGRVDFVEGGDYDRIPFGAPRGLYDAQHLFMPRFSFAYSLNPETVFRGGVGLFYDKPEGNVIFSQLNIPPVLANSLYENFNISNPSGGAAGAVGAVGTINAIDPSLKLPYQTNYSLGVQRQFGARLLCRGDIRRQHRAQPDSPAGHQPRQFRRAAPQRGAAGRPARVGELPAAVQGLLVDSHARQRRQLAVPLDAVVRRQAYR